MKTIDEIKQAVALRFGYKDFLTGIMDRAKAESRFTVTELVNLAIEEYAEQVKPKWISVKNRLPEYYKSVLCLNDDKSINVCWRANDDKPYDIYTITGTDNCLIKPPTHWMPLPEFKEK